MPKTPVITVTADIDAIMAQIADIEHLLEGRLDSDNIQVEGGDISRISGASVYGIADFGRPVVADKLIADYSGSDPDVQSVSFEDDVYTKLVEEIKDRPQFDISKVKFAFDITNKEEGIRPESESIVKFSGELSDEDKALASARRSVYADYERRIAEWRASKTSSDGGRSQGIAAGGIGTVAVVGTTAAAASGPGAPVVLAGAALFGAALGFSKINEGNDSPKPTISGLSVLGDGYLQTKFIKHPPNFKVATHWDIYQFALYDGSFFAPFIFPSDKRIYEKFPAISSSVSVKYKSNDDGWANIPYDFTVTQIDPETTAVTIFLDTTIRPTGDTDFLTVLCDAEILFKVLP
jgi:hypothetical protein